MLETVGVTLLRMVATDLSGDGIQVAQVESPVGAGSLAPFEMNPNHATSHPASRFAEKPSPLSTRKSSPLCKIVAS